MLFLFVSPQRGAFVVSLPRVFLLLRCRRCFLRLLRGRRRFPRLFRHRWCFLCVVAAGAFCFYFAAASPVLAALPHVLLAILCPRCVLCSVAAGAFFICFVASDNFVDSLPRVFVLLRCRKCLPCYVASSPQAFSLFISAPLVLSLFCCRNCSLHLFRRSELFQGFANRNGISDALPRFRRLLSPKLP